MSFHRGQTTAGIWTKFGICSPWDLESVLSYKASVPGRPLTKNFAKQKLQNAHGLRGPGGVRSEVKGQGRDQKAERAALSMTLKVDRKGAKRQLSV